jgi:hypothetical protein
MEVSDVVDLFDSLMDAGFYAYHKEANLVCGPGCVEYFFVHKDHIGFQ